MKTNGPINEPLNSAWRFFDRIYCISLTQRPDRRQTAQREFQRVGLAGQFEFFLVDKHPSNSEQGIFESHLSCLRAGLKAGARHILIFEDDIYFRRFSPKRLVEAIAFLRTDPGCDILFLGCFAKSSKKTPFRSILKIRFRCATQGYIIHRDFAEKLVRLPWTGIAYDDLLRSMDNDRFYIVYPSFAYQTASPTDNQNMLSIDRTRRMLGGFRVLQRWNEFSNHNLVPMIVVHVVIVLLIVCGLAVYKFSR